MKNRKHAGRPAILSPGQWKVVWLVSKKGDDSSVLVRVIEHATYWLGFHVGGRKNAPIKAWYAFFYRIASKEEAERLDAEYGTDSTKLNEAANDNQNE